MGNSISWIWTRLFGVRKKRVLMVGLDNSGKTTLLYRLKYGKVVETSPTNCFNLESFEHGDEIVEVWDIGGRWTIRTHFYPNTDGLIFVFDVSDKGRIEEANLSLLNTLRQEHLGLGNAPLLILSNKLDKLPPTSGACEKLTDAHGKNSYNNLLEVDEIGIRKIKPDIMIRIQPCSAIRGEGLSHGMDWLCHAMNNHEKLSSSDSQTV